MDETDRLARMLRDAAHGAFPPADGSVDVLPRPAGRAQAVIGFTGHHVVAADVVPERVRERIGDGEVGTAMSVPFLAWLAETLGARPGMLDLVLVTLGTQEIRPLVDLVPRDDLDDHPRVARSLGVRDDVRVFTDPDGGAMLTLGRGLAGRWEISIEVEPAFRERGIGRTMAAAAATLIAPGEPLFAQVTPGNSASLRAFLAGGYWPIGSEILFLPS